MSKYRKKHIVQAEQFNGTQEHAVELGLDYSGTADCGPLVFSVRTPEGRLQVRKDDWVITGIAGEKYPCNPDIFTATYEAVKEDTDTGTELENHVEHHPV